VLVLEFLETCSGIFGNLCNVGSTRDFANINVLLPLEHLFALSIGRAQCKQQAPEAVPVWYMPAAVGGGATAVAAVLSCGAGSSGLW